MTTVDRAIIFGFSILTIVLGFDYLTFMLFNSERLSKI
jgi:hypothetical protein